jgi:capsular polysaccharide biosynthesis protein
MSELEDGFQLANGLALLRRQFAVILVAVAVGAVAGYLVLASAPTKYSATARVEVDANPLDASGNGTPTPPSMQNEQDLVKSDNVATTVRTTLKLPGDNKAVLSHISVTITDKSNVLQITFVAADGATARDGANAAATAYLQQRKSAVADSIKRKEATLNKQVADQQNALQQAQSAVDATAPASNARSQAQAALGQVNAKITALNTSLAGVTSIDVDSVGSLVRKAPESPALVTSKKALAKGVGIFGLIVVIGLLAAWLLDRRDTLGGGRRRVEQALPGAGSRVLPGAEGRGASPAEIDTAIDRLAVELVSSGAASTPTSVLVIGAGSEPPVALAEELASSLTFAGIRALFVLAGTTDRELRHVHVVASFADLLSGPSVSGPASLPAQAGGTPTPGPTVTWLRPRGSAESSGLLRRAVVDTLVARAGREQYEAVVFVTASPARTAAATALGQWVTRTILVVGDGERVEAEGAAQALADADVSVSEVVWT